MVSKVACVTYSQTHRYNEVVKESNFTIVPKGGRVYYHSTGFVSVAHLAEQQPIPLLVHMPVLHGMGNITRLYNVLQHNRPAKTVVRGTTSRIEGVDTSSPTQVVHLLVKHISGKNNVDHHLAKSDHFGVAVTKRHRLKLTSSSLMSRFQAVSKEYCSATLVPV